MKTKPHLPAKNISYVHIKLSLWISFIQQRIQQSSSSTETIIFISAALCIPLLTILPQLPLFIKHALLLNPSDNLSVFPGFVQTVKYCFPGLSRTCKDQIPGFSRTHKTHFQWLSRTNSIHKHGCIRSKTCTYQISYQCNCITVNKPKCNNWNSNRPKT